MNVTGSKYFSWLLQIWRDEQCASRVEGAILACGMATAVLLAAIGLEGELRQVYELAASLVGLIVP